MALTAGSGMHPEKQLRSESAILRLKELELGLLAVLDASYTLRFIDLKTYRLFGGIRLPCPENPPPLAADIAYRGNFCLVASPEGGSAQLFSVKKQKTLCQLGAHGGNVSAVAFDPEGRYGVTAGEDGKVAVWDLKNGRRAFNVSPHSDGVLAVAFDASGHHIATGGHDRVVQLSKAGSAKAPMMLRSHAGAVSALLFAGERGLVSADMAGGIALWDTATGKLLKRLEHTDGPVRALCCDSEARMLFAATQKGTVALYDLVSKEMLIARFLTFSHPVSAMAYCVQSRRLCIGTEDGMISSYDLFGDSGALEEAYDKGDFGMLYDMARKNPVVRFSPSFVAMEEAWEAVLLEVDRLIAEDRTEACGRLLAPFTAVVSKQQKIADVKTELECFERFKEHVENARYSLAYDLASKYPRLQNSRQYADMENEWHATYDRAYRMLGDRRTEAEGRELLARFRGISQKTAAIRELLEERKRYVYFKELIAKQEWKKASELARHHPQLEGTDAYNTLLNIADKLFISAQKAYSANDYKNAEAACRVLMDFPDYKEDAAALLERLKG